VAARLRVREIDDDEGRGSGPAATWRRALREEGTTEMLDGLARYLTAQPAS
jgi:hypothetical protein